MEECRLVVHPGTVDKCERLGIENCGGDGAEFFGIFKDSGVNVKEDDFFRNGMTYQDFIASSLPELKNEEFMALPEPLKVGDWFFHFKSESSVEIKKVFRIDGDKIYIDGSMFCYSGKSRKLTPEQIKVLEL